MTPGLQGRDPGQVGAGTEETQLDPSPTIPPHPSVTLELGDGRRDQTRGHLPRKGRESRRQPRPHSHGARAATCS